MPGWLTAIAVLHGGCAALYVVLSGLVLVQGRLSRSGRLSQTGRLFAIACLATAVWAGAVAGMAVSQLSLPGGPLDVVRAAVWCGFILHLYLRAVRGRQQRIRRDRDVIHRQRAECDAGQVDMPARVLGRVEIQVFDQQHAAHGHSEPRYHLAVPH